MGSGLNYEPFYEDDFPSTTLKQITMENDLSYTKFRRDQFKIYKDLLGHEDEETHLEVSFQDIEYEFIVHGMKKSKLIKFNSLPLIPKVGENIDFSFFQSYMGTTLFHVASVLHIFEDQK